MIIKLNLQAEEGDKMKYVSTRGNEQKLQSAEAVIAGIAKDGGLFVPTEFPQIDMDFIESLVDLTYQQRAVKVLRTFLVDYTQAEIEACVNGAYGGDRFDTDQIAPLAEVGATEVLELWHGPTSAFKDMALQLLPQLMSTALKKTGEKDQIVILVATSGDTGKAALEGFKDVDQIRIIVFYPNGGVSKMQYLQMATQPGSNVAVVAVNGNFDDTQTGVKKIFADQAFKAKLKAKGVQLSSANSINWGRLVPQIVYYFSTYADLLQQKKIALGEKINFSVPTGNFGNILAGYYAKNMGLPIHKLICASNTNNVLTDFLQNGIYDRNREFFKTITPSMDILISSNLERLLYHVTGGNTKQIETWMKQLSTDGKYAVGNSYIKEIQEIFWSGWADDEKTKETIREVYAAHEYVMDTHTAVAWQVAEEYKKATGDLTHTVVVSTASPYKFNDSVLNALGRDVEGKDEFALLADLESFNKMKAPVGLAKLQEMTVLHADLCDRTAMAATVEAKIK